MRIRLTRLTLQLLLVFLFAGSSGAAVPNPKGWLGFGFTLHEDPASAASNAKRYLYLRHVLPGGPAGTAGLQIGDLIIAIDRRPIEFKNDTAALDFFARLRPGDVLLLSVARKSRRMQIHVVVASPPGYWDALWRRNYEMSHRHDSSH